MEWLILNIYLEPIFILMVPNRDEGFLEDYIIEVYNSLNDESLIFIDDVTIFLVSSRP